MTILKPILENTEVRTYNGRFKVQLEIPEGSTLTPRDIDKIGVLASWSIDPNTWIEGYEGVRSVLISRENSLERRGLEFPLLQLSGIGHRTFYQDKDTILRLEDNSTFEPPCLDNFMDLMHDENSMSTGFALNGKLNQSRPDYRALGTYTHTELVEKIRKTDIASKLDIAGLVTPTVEVYGRYLDDSLKRDEGNFGFLCFPYPQKEKQRYSTELSDRFQEFVRENPKVSITDAALYFCDISRPGIIGFEMVLRGLHEKRFAHLQAHSGNYHVFDFTPEGKKGSDLAFYLSDWATMTRLEEDRENNVINMAIDIERPVENFNSFLKYFFGKLPPKTILDLTEQMLRRALNTYSGRKTSTEDTCAELIYAESRCRKDKGSRFTLNRTVQWIKDRGYEGFPICDCKMAPGEDLVIVLDHSNPDYSTKALVPNLRELKQIVEPKLQRPVYNSIEPIRTTSKKVGRNDSCPCGSGKKFKQCCRKK